MSTYPKTVLMYDTTSTVLSGKVTGSKRRRLRVSEDCWLDFQESENHYRVDAGYGQVTERFPYEKMHFYIVSLVRLSHFSWKHRVQSHLSSSDVKHFTAPACLCFVL